MPNYRIPRNESRRGSRIMHTRQETMQPAPVDANDRGRAAPTVCRRDGPLYFPMIS